MQRGLTWFLLAAALGLFAVIYFFESRIPGAAERREPKRLFPEGSAAEIASLEVTLSSNAVVRAERTNGIWMLTDPRYPARQLALDTFATNVAEIRVLDRIARTEVSRHDAKSFGLDPPRAKVDVRFAADRFRFEVGGYAPITSNIYLRLPDSGEVLLADAGLLNALPRDTNHWRTPALFQLSGLDFDRIQIRSGQRSFELGRSNNIWQISKPLPARADEERVMDLLHIFRSAEATEFITDSPGADLERFGLQTPVVEVGFALGTNRIFGIEFGNSPANRTNQVFARLLGNTNIVLAPRGLAEFLRQPYKNFHDPRLVSLKAAVLDRVIVHAREDFTVQRQPEGSWAAVEGKSRIPVDLELLANTVKAVNSLQIVDIVKEVPTEADLKAFGFTPSSASYAFFEKLTNTTGMATNILSTELHFGGTQTDKVYVRRSDETPVYQTQLGVMMELPRRAFELRDRKIWRFATNQLASITLSAAAGTNTIPRLTAGWSADAIANATIEEVVFRLAHLNAQDWVEKGSARLPTFGINDSSLRLALELRAPGNSQELFLHFGRQTLGRNVYAAVLFPGEKEPAIFEFPGDLFQMMLQALPVPN